MDSARKRASQCIGSDWEKVKQIDSAEAEISKRFTNKVVHYTSSFWFLAVVESFQESTKGKDERTFFCSLTSADFVTM